MYRFAATSQVEFSPESAFFLGENLKKVLRHVLVASAGSCLLMVSIASAMMMVRRILIKL